jgi:acetyltransferase EpsM
VVAQTLRAEGRYQLLGLLDDDVAKHGTEVLGLPVLGGVEWLFENFEQGIGAIVGIGNNDLRREIGDRLRQEGIAIVNAIHPSAVVMEGAALSTGCLICAGAVIVTGVIVERDVVVNTGATIDHDSILHAGSMIASGVHTAGCVTLGYSAFVGTGSIIGPGVQIGSRTIVGIGSLVLDDLPSDVLAYGSPAKTVRKLENSIDWARILGGA